MELRPDSWSSLTTKNIVKTRPKNISVFTRRIIVNLCVALDKLTWQLPGMSYECFPIDMATHVTWLFCCNEQRSFRHEQLFYTWTTLNDVLKPILKHTYCRLPEKVRTACLSTAQRCALLVDIKVTVDLHFYANGSFQSVVRDMGHLSQGSTSQIVNSTSQSLVLMSREAMFLNVVASSGTYLSQWAQQCEDIKGGSSFGETIVFAHEKEFMATQIWNLFEWLVVVGMQWQHQTIKHAHKVRYEHRIGLNFSIPPKKYGGRSHGFQRRQARS